MAGKGPEPRPGFNPKRYEQSDIWKKLGPDKCIINKKSKATCKNGTKGCKVDHK